MRSCGQTLSKYMHTLLRFHLVVCATCVLRLDSSLTLALKHRPHRPLTHHMNVITLLSLLEDLKHNISSKQKIKTVHCDLVRLYM